MYMAYLVTEGKRTMRMMMMTTIPTIDTSVGSVLEVVEGTNGHECILLSISRLIYIIYCSKFLQQPLRFVCCCFFTYFATELYSGLAVLPNPNELGSSNTSGAASRDIVFGLAQEASGGDGENSEEQVRRTITMVTYDLSDNAFHMSHVTQVNTKSYLSRYRTLSLSLTF